VIPGCEFSVRAPWGELHVLALFLPPETERLQSFLRETRAARRRRGEQIVAKLQGLGVAIQLEDVEAQLSGGDGGALGRPHVARALVDCGACEDITDAFRRYLGRGRAAYVEKPLPTLSEVTSLVHEVGGLTVAAHLGDHGTEGQLRTFQDQDWTVSRCATRAILRPSSSDSCASPSGLGSGSAAARTGTAKVSMATPTRRSAA